MKPHLIGHRILSAGLIAPGRGGPTESPPPAPEAVRKGIARKIVILLFAFGIVPLVVVALVFLSATIRSQKASVRTLQQEIGNRITVAISASLNRAISTITVFGLSLDPASDSRAGLCRRASALLERETEFDHLFLMDGTGDEICKVSRFYTFRPSELTNVAGSVAFETALAGRVHISDVLVSDFSKFPQIRISAPARGPGDRVTGVIRAGLDISRIWRLISRHSIGQDRYAYIVDAQGRLIAHEDLSSVLEKRRLTDIRVVRRFLDGEVGVSRYRGLHDEPVIGAVSRIPQTGWGVVVETPVRAAYAPLRLLTAAFAGVILLTTAAAVILGLLFSYRFLIGPIRRLREETHAISRGDWDRRLHLAAGDELGQLADSVNQMLEALRKTSVSRDALIQEVDERKRAEGALRYRVAFEGITSQISTHFINLAAEEVDEGIDLALSRIGAFAGVDRAYVFLFREDGRTADNTHEWCAQGIPHFRPDLQGIDVPSELPGVDAVLRRFGVYHVPDVADLPAEADRERMLFEEEAIQSLIVVPMASRGRLIGFVGFDAVRERRVWTEDETFLLQTVGEIFVNALAHRRAEAALLASEGRYRMIFKHSPLGIAQVDADGVIIDCNDKFAEIIGGEREAIIGFNLFHEIRDGPVREAVLEALAQGTSKYEGEYRSVTGDKKIALKAVFQRFSDSAGRVMGGIGIIEDVSERRKLELQLQQAQKMEAVGALAGGIAHDFNNLLTAVEGYAALVLMDLADDHPAREKIHRIARAVERGTELTRQLLGFARGGKYEVVPSDLNGLIREQNDIFGRTRKEIVLHEDFADDPWTVEVDQGQFVQVLMNLYINASQAMPDGGAIHVKTSNQFLDETYVKPFKVTPGPCVKVSVTDTGTGIPAAIRDRIFEPFFTTKEVGKGTGLGLSSVYGIVKNHGGHITVYSEEGIGTTFNIYLPASEKEAVVEKPVDIAAVELGKGTVLLVDDEELILEVGKEMIETLGYDVVPAASGRDAAAALREAPAAVDLVILDMIMPDMSGAQTFDALKAIDPEVKILLSSGYSVNGQASDILSRGCDGFIQKPYSIHRLSDKIREVLGKEAGP
jgi:two-component system, cell cycle sensor histidine kinase and response regulator CckA